MIILDQVKKVFQTSSGQVTAVDSVNLEIKKGEIFGIIGYSGAGKSTLIRMLNLLERPTDGTVTIDGKDLTKVSAKELRLARQQIGMVFQHFNLLWSRTVYENIAFSLEIAGVKKNEIKPRVLELIQLVGLSGKENNYPSQLSGGQKQRVAIAGIIAMRPSILILDEATSMLDPEGRQELIQYIEDIRQQYGMTVLSITHDLDEVAMSNRVLVLKQGKVESISSPRELFSRGSELVDLGLDIPFSALLTQKLKNQGLIDCEGYLTEKELVEQLWEYLSKM